LPVRNARNRVELVWLACAPERNAQRLAIQDPANGEIEDRFAIIVAGKGLERRDGGEILRKARRPEFGVVAAQIVAAEGRVSVHLAGKQAATERTIGEGRDIVFRSI